MVTKPKISFVIPAHNEENYIGNCLDSVLKEISRENLPAEIIVVNNNSSDNTKKIVSAYPNVKLANEPVMGVPRARQRGFLESQAPLVCFIDADTKMPSGWLKTAIKEFAKNPELVCLSGPQKFYDTSKLMIPAIKYYHLMMYTTYLIMRHMLRITSMIQGGNFIVRRDALLKIGGFSHHFDFYGEETDTAVRLHKIGDVKFSLRLPIESSARRFAKEGFAVISWCYAVEYFWVIMFKKPFHKEYIADIRFNPNQKFKMFDSKKLQRRTAMASKARKI